MTVPPVFALLLGYAPYRHHAEHAGFQCGARLRFFPGLRARRQELASLLSLAECFGRLLAVWSESLRNP